MAKRIVSISTLDYVVKNFHTGGDTALEEIRQEALKELAELRQAACQVEKQKTVLSGETL